MSEFVKIATITFELVYESEEGESEKDHFELVSRVIDGVTYTKEELGVLEVSKNIQRKISECLKGDFFDINKIPIVDSKYTYRLLETGRLPSTKTQALLQQESEEQFVKMLDKAKRDLDKI